MRAFLLFLAWVGVALPAFAKGVQLDIQGKALTATYHHEVSTAGIQSMSHLKVPSWAKEEPGLTLFEYQLAANFDMGLNQTDPKGPVRVWPTIIHVNFAVLKLDVYVSSQYPEGSCQYRVVMAHERTHAAINGRIYWKYRKLLKKELARLGLPTASHPWTATTEAEGRERIRERIKPVVDRIEARFYAELKRENAKIDTRANYAKTSQKCKGW